jgi:RNA polymerase sigma-70 factor (ECF subfamily)
MPNALDAVDSSRSTNGEAHLDDATATFAQLRRRLFGIAYRIVGSWTEAEDVVQEAWVRWQTCDRTTVRNSTAFLVTATTRLAINATQSARRRRESYVTRWMSEPVATADDPATGAERGEALEIGIQLLLERCSSTERAAYILRHAFAYPYPRIADVLRLTEANARQLVSRATKHIALGRRQTVSRDVQQQLLRAFVAAANHGDVATLEALFGARSIA